ncbi:MAG: hypothetical protein FGF48_06750 [Candidatus Brockarchaeota archaeon]|nr:hypothetical protein [Candidatus Brockarchaeota archaeon]
MEKISWKRIRRAIILGAVWGFVSSCVILLQYDLIATIKYFEEHCQLTPEVWDLISIEETLLKAIFFVTTHIVFFPAVPFRNLGLLGVFLTMLTGAAIRTIVELFLEIRRSRRRDMVE